MRWRTVLLGTDGTLAGSSFDSVEAAGMQRGAHFLSVRQIGPFN